MTSERKAVVEKVLSCKEAFSADLLHSMMLADGFHLSRATVYNTLSILLDSGVVERRDGSWVVSDGRPVHITLTCTGCGRKRGIKDRVIAELLVSRRIKSFVTQGAEVSLTGICAACAGKTAKKPKN